MSTNNKKNDVRRTLEQVGEPFRVHGTLSAFLGAQEATPQRATQTARLPYATIYMYYMHLLKNLGGVCSSDQR